MTPEHAAKLLDVPVDATPVQLETRFLELRTRLEDKIAKAPTPGLKAKYRESLTEITTAFETLILAADSSSLPVAQKSGGPVSPRAGSNVGPDRHRPGDGGSPLAATSPTRSAPAPTLQAKPKSGGKEFLIVALIAVLLLGAGGWFVMTTRAEKAEQARIAAETLQKKQAADQAEAARIHAVKTSLRTKLAEARVDWEARESELQDAERRTSELKSELRGSRDFAPTKKAELSAQLTAQELYTRWLKDNLLRHPAKLARARAEELLQAGAFDEATTVVGEITTALEKLAEDIETRRKYFFQPTGDVRIRSQPAGVRWILTDAYGRTREGVTPAVVDGLPFTHLARDGVPVAPFETEKHGEFTTGRISVRFVRPGWADVIAESEMVLDDNRVFEATFPEGSVAVSSLPPGVPFKITQLIDDHGWTATGKTPATVPAVPVGRVRVTLSRPGYADVFQNLDIEEGKTAKTLELDHRSQPVRIQVAEAARIFVDGKSVGTTDVQLTTLTPGEHSLQLESSGYKPYRSKFSIKQTPTPVTLSFSFKQLATENITCGNCGGGGRVNRQERCNRCNGTSRVDCEDCTNGVSGYVMGDYGGGVMGQKMVRCTSCNGKGYFPCNNCTNGVYHWQDSCPSCGGDGKVSKLQLAQ